MIFGHLNIDLNEKMTEPLSIVRIRAIKRFFRGVLSLLVFELGVVILIPHPLPHQLEGV